VRGQGVDLRRLIDALELLLAQRVERELLAQEEIGDRAGHADAAGVGERFDPRRDVDRSAADVAVVVQLHLAGVESRSNLTSDLGEAIEESGGAFDRIDRVVEDREDTARGRSRCGATSGRIVSLWPLAVEVVTGGRSYGAGM
jgi:hypothetical protein